MEEMFTKEFDLFIETNKELINNNYYISNIDLCKNFKVDSTTFFKIGLKEKLLINKSRYMILLDEESLLILKELFYIKKKVYLNYTEAISYIKKECNITGNFNRSSFENLINLLEIPILTISFIFKNNNTFFTKDSLLPIVSFIKDFISQNNNKYSGTGFQQYWSSYTERKYFKIFEEKYSIKFWRNFLKEREGDAASFKHVCSYLDIPILKFDFQKEIPSRKLGRVISCEYISQEDYLKLINFLDTHTLQERIKIQRESTILKRFGVINNSCTQEWRDQVKEKSLKDWGTEWPTQSEKFKKKTIKSNIEKYGVESPNSLPEKIEKQVKTYKERYSDPNSEYAIKRKEKAVATSRKRYGTDNPNQSNIVKNKNKETKKKRIELNKKEIQKELNINENLLTIAESCKILRKLRNKNNIHEVEIRKIVRKINEPLIKGIYSFYIKESTLNKLIELGFWTQDNVSQGEKYLIHILNAYNINYIYQYKNIFCKNILPLPFDFYLPDYNVAIEYQGEQHFHPISRLGNHILAKEESIKEFERNQKHDKIKREFCEQSDIILLTPDYRNTYKEIEEIIKETLGID